VPDDDQKEPGRTAAGNRTGAPYVVPPDTLRAFPQAEKVRPKTARPGGVGLRARWKDAAKQRIYEWDYRHGTVEVYDFRGHHLGECDAETGHQVKGPEPGRRVVP
jgi:hypothetical protein